MIREKTASSGPRPEFSSKSHENYDPTPRPRAGSTRDTTLNASLLSSHSLFSFGGIDDNPSGSFDFLPSPSFDDLQSSISSSNDLHSQFPAPGGASKIITDKRTIAAMDTSLNEGRGTAAAARASTGPRPIRSGSIVRRQSTSTRQSSISSTTSGASGVMDPPSAPLAMRNRRPSQYPPVSGTGAANGPLKGPRRSIGAGSIDADFTRPVPTQRRRPSLASNSSAQGLSDAAVSTRLNIGNGGKYTEGARGPTSSRASKTKSLQPPATQAQALLTVSTPEHSRSSSFTPRQSTQRVNTPSSSAKRMSVVHGLSQSTHATGLGARTISPTDARRAKRLSVLQNAPSLKNPPPLPNTPPTTQPDASMLRTSSRSPSALPRKTPTPSSINLTFGSRLSTGSTASYNAVRISTGSLQPRVPPPATSRLPAPKTRSLHSAAGNNDDDDVPPVPAIPRAYESPKESPAEPTLIFSSRKSSLPFDTSSINSTSTNSLSGIGSAREPIKSDRDSKHRHLVPLGSSSDVDQQNNATPVKKNLQPLRLPPLNLLPLSTPTAAKIAALQEPAVTEGKTTPPPRRGVPTTPSTPMTASKASFFARNRPDEKADINSQHLRSSSSAHHLRSESPSQIDASSSESSKPIPIPNRAGRQAVSPFISSSLPKHSGEHSYMPRSKTSGDFTTMDTSLENRPTRVNGPRAQKVTKPQKIETPPEISSPEPTTPSSNSSIRRKLSLSWKRNTSKNNLSISHAANERDSEYAPPPPKHDSMPPPKLPASATVNNLSSYTVPSPSPSIKSTTYLDSKRRKSSASSLTLVNGHDRTRSDSWGLNSSPKKDQSETKPEKPAPPARTTSSTLQKMLGSKPSMSTMSTARTRPWALDLDKDDLQAEEEMKKLGSKRKETESAAKQLDALRKRATPKERVSPQQALQMASLNIYERGEIVDYKDIYFCGTNNAQKHVGELTATAVNFGFDDERGDYSIVYGDHLLYRYEVVDVLGKGSFGQVVRCIDHKTGGLVAVKIIRNKKRFHQQALVEVNILKKLREWDPQNKHSMVNFTQSFYFRGHLCISTELLDMNLYEFIKSNAFRGFSLKIVRRFTKQLLNSLVLLKQHKVIHCDLKPENVLLAHPLHSEIKVIDFGSSCFENEKVYTYIQSRFYRSPEVILGMTYGLPIDMWSLGCILAELYTGVPIFPGENEQEQLACIMEVFGPPEKHLIEKSSRKKLFFDSLGKPRLTVSSKGRRRRPSSKSLQQVLKCDDEPFLDFLTRCMRWDPDRRLKPEDAIRHEFITGQKSSMAPIRAHYPRTESPTKRHHAIATLATSNRPLPEPPATSFKNGTAVRPREATGASPIKNPPTTARRTSNIASLNNTTGSRRISTGPGAPTGPGASGLPRVTRSVSAKQEMASAGATAAMGRRA
ncbi:hypothetical protein OIDMADRAFT_113554 [Oidiodendron maius Zn]|uniref:dual-specificity kinase n=1 Tax=Oidiodendron maius (strain Zn) TaxID=913774 RepID=A0A0C3HBQ8_OIDMZ|nr:hypothetical protein OIDMADRAFT_113554 [Oidiodendron maius Zn]